jgi:preprotein translocase subunit SecF
MLTMFVNSNYDFMSKRRVFFIISGILILIGIGSMAMQGGLRMGIDFAGGRLIEYRMSEQVPVEEMRAAVADAGFQNAEIQAVGNTKDILIRIPDVADQAGGAESPSYTILKTLKSRNPELDGELLREESVGAKIGMEIRKQAFWAIIIAMGLILIYIAIRFEFRFGIGAILALAHDVLIVLMLFSIFNKEITMPVIAALLTIAGYSINDSIVVFDRIREQLVRLRRESFFGVVNISINQTLSRTIVTSVTTLMTSVSLLIFGGEVIHDFAFAMTAGVIVGTYSSIFIASSSVLELRERSERKAKA